MAGSPNILIVEARFYDDISDALLEGAKAVLDHAGASYEVVTVPGALEIPAAVAMALRAGAPYNGYVALGCVIRGETAHFDIVAGESARGLMDISVAYAVPIGNGIITVENEAQAWARARSADQNKGGAAAEAALAMISLKQKLGAV
jgi:6,7-dimethyl-8-ribityllumazine synthase